MLTERHYQKRWHGRIKGVPVEIANWYSSPDGDWDNPDRSSYRLATTWNYYLTVRDDMLPRPLFMKHFWLTTKLNTFGSYDEDYYCERAGLMNHLPWHGGLTYYEKTERKHPKTPRSVKMGCDYNHAFDHDRGFEYRFDTVLRDATETVEDLLSSLPFFKFNPTKHKWE